MTDDKKQPETDQDTTSQTAESDASDSEETTAEADDQAPESPDLVALLKAENLDLKDRYVRLAAEMDNLRKRTEREKADMAKYAISDFARDVLTISDNFQRAIGAVSPEAADQDEVLRGFLDGVEMNERELQKVLERHGVNKVDPKGEKFDPNIHQAVQQVENQDLPNNTVCDVYQVGYMIADRVLRHAVVAVAKGGPKNASPQSSAPEAKTEPQPKSNEETPEAKETPAGDQEPSASGDVGSTVDKNV